MAIEDPVAGEPPIPHRGPGRPRDASRDEAILTATVALLRRRGYPGLTIEGVASEAGVGRPTIYRRWPSKAALVVAALMDSSLLALPAPDTGSVRDDLIALMHGAFEAAEHPQKQPLMAALTAEAAVNPEMKRLLREYTQRRRDSSAIVVRRAIERGELAADTDPDFLLDLIAGPLFYRVQMAGRPVGEQIVVDVVDVVLGGLAARKG